MQYIKPQINADERRLNDVLQKSIVAVLELALSKGVVFVQYIKPQINADERRRAEQSSYSPAGENPA